MLKHGPNTRFAGKGHEWPYELALASKGSATSQDASEARRDINTNASAFTREACDILVVPILVLRRAALKEYSVNIAVLLDVTSVPFAGVHLLKSLPELLDLFLSRLHFLTNASG